MGDSAVEYNIQGLRMVNLGKYADAVDYFSKSIELDPLFADAYQNRGEAYIFLERFVEGQADIYKAKEIKAGRAKGQKKQGAHAKINLQEVDNLYDSLFADPAGDSDDPSLQFDEGIFDYVFSDETIEDHATWEGLAGEQEDTATHPAIVEYLGGGRHEVAGLFLCTPFDDTVSVISKRGDAEEVIRLEKFTCIRTSQVPSRYSELANRTGSVEIIETIDGNMYHELIPAQREQDNLLFGFSTKEQTPFTFTFIPRVNIRRRRQQRLLGDILLEKRFITGDILKNALNDYHHTKSLKLGKIVAEMAHIRHATVEEELERAKQGPALGLRTGEILLASGLVNEEQILAALEYQETIRNLKIGQFLVEKGIVPEREIYLSLAEKHRIPFMDLRTQKISKKVLTSLPKDMVVAHEIIPIAMNDGTLVVATHFVDMTGLCETILKAAKCQQVQYVLAQPRHIRNIISLLYKRGGVDN